MNFGTAFRQVDLATIPQPWHRPGSMKMGNPLSPSFHTSQYSLLPSYEEESHIERADTPTHAAQDRPKFWWMKHPKVGLVVIYLFEVVCLGIATYLVFHNNESYEVSCFRSCFPSIVRSDRRRGRGKEHTDDAMWPLG
jgi:hypothetical protein